jgi:hypothetical protein
VDSSPRKQFCHTCRNPINYDGFAWYHLDTGFYLAYADEARRIVEHEAAPGGRAPKKKREKK